jgi:type I restriction enzyme S subunit
MSDDYDLPDGWVVKPLGDAVQPVKDKVDPTSVPEANYVGLEHVEAHSMRLLGHGHGSDVKSTKTKFSAGDVLYGKLRPYLNKVARPTFDGISSTDFLVFTESTYLEPSYLAQFLNQLSVANYAHHLSAGVELPRVDWKSLSALPIPFPLAKDEQRAVVAQIERVRGLGESADAHLRQAHRAIERFRQAVLLAACSGQLTEAWRSLNPHSAPTVPDRRASRRRQRSEEAMVELDLPDFPDSYTLATIGTVATILEYGTSKKAAIAAEGVPVLRMGNIQDGCLTVEDLKYCPVDREIERLILRDGDLLFNRTNSPELVGKTAVFHERAKMTFASYLIRVRFDPEVADPNFVNYWLNSAWGRAWAWRVKTDGVSQSNINGTKLGAMPLPLPPIEEQHQIVKVASAVLAVADSLVARVDAVGRRSEQASQSVLARAFKGKLNITTMIAKAGA